MNNQDMIVEQWREHLGGQLEQVAAQVTVRGHATAAACMSIVAGAVYAGHETALVPWMMWFVRWRMLLWQVHDQWERFTNEAP